MADVCYRLSYLPACEGGNDRSELIEKYFHLGFEYKDIVSFLSLYHGITISIRQLKRVLVKLGLKRKGDNINDVDKMFSAIKNELCGSGCCLGYRAMHQRLRNDHHLQVDRETVRIALGLLDPDGVQRRKRHKLIRRKYRSKGPNYCWHMDGYDKLKPFGFCIHGCIDGYSRRIMWLTVASTNNNPAVTAQYFIDCVKVINGAPKRLRSDCGTENVNVEVLQTFFTSDEDSFQYGTSIANQRIEAWWSYLRKGNTDFWINYFKDLRDSGIFDDNNILHSSCLKFCFMGLLQNELDRVARHWNTHRIRPYPNQETPSGRPDVLYFLSETQGIEDYKVQIDLGDAEIAEVMGERPPLFGCPQEFSDVFSMLMEENNMNMPKSVSEAQALYLNLIQLTEAIL